MPPKPLKIAEIILLIVVFVGGVWWLMRMQNPIQSTLPQSVSMNPTPTSISTSKSPSPSPTFIDTSTWKTYSDSQYEFEFRYPIGLALSHENDTEPYSPKTPAHVATTYTYDACPEFCPVFMVRVLQKGEFSNIDALSKANWASYQRTTVQGYPATYVEYQDPSGLTREYFVWKGDQPYWLYVTPFDDIPFSEIFASFKFIK